MKKEIVFCIPQLYGGGAEQQIKYLAAIFKNDFRVKIIVLNNQKTEGIDPNIKIIKIKKLTFRSLKSILILRNEIKNNYVISASTYFDILCGLLMKITKFKWWIRESNSSKARKVSLKNSLRKFLGKKANGIIANSKSGYKYWNKINKNSRIIFNGYPDEILERSKKKKKSFALIVSRMQPHKKVKSAIDLFVKLKNDGKVNKLIICGDGPDFYEIKKYANASIFSKYIDIKGFVSHQELQELFSFAKYFLSMSLYEGTPNTAVEALANNCQVYLSGSDSHKDFFQKTIVNFVNMENLEYKRNSEINRKKISEFLGKCKLKKTYYLYKKFLKL